MKILSVLVLLVSTSAFAKNSIVKFYDVNTFSKAAVTLFLDSGEIVKVPLENIELIKKVKEAYKTGRKFTVSKAKSNTNQADILSDIEFTKNHDKEELTAKQQKDMYSWERLVAMNMQTQDPLEKAKITKLSSFDKAQNIMSTFNGKTSDDSQCYNRAHMWSYEAKIQHNVNFGKVWLFFTDKYIKEYNYKWWFHIAPYTQVRGESELYVLDRGFTLKPYELNSWKNLFMRNKASCPIVQDYQEYKEGEANEYCFMILSSQYYWQPWQVEWLSTKNVPRYGYKEEELKVAYEDALISWDGTLPRMTSSPIPVSNNTETSREETVEETRTSVSVGSSSTSRPAVVELVEEEDDYNYNPGAGFINRGDIVIDNDNDIGRVIRIIDERTALIDYDNYSSHYERSISQISKKVIEKNGIKSGNKIIDQDNDTGEVIHVFDNGKALVDFDNYSKHFVKYTYKLGKQVKCHSNVCAKNRVIDGDLDTGRVISVYSNGKVKVDYDRYSSHYVRLSSKLGVGKRCVGELCTKKRVIDGENDLGTVLEVFSNNLALIDYDQYSQHYAKRVSTLGISQKCKNGFCKGDRVEDNDGDLGRILELFSNGKAYIDYDLYSSNFVRRTWEISKR